METADLFASIASHYDHWSNLLSGEGIRAWHRFAVDELDIQPGNAVLDVGCGTGTMTQVMAGRAGRSGCVIGLDPSSSMLSEARTRPLSAESAAIAWVDGDGEHLPFDDQRFDRVTAQFSLRNMDDWVQGIKEMVRVLKPGGRLVVLEMVQPTSSLGSLAWHGLRSVTQRFTAETLQAYQWLGLSVEHAPTGDEVAFEVRRFGVVEVKMHHWLGDLVMVLSGRKAAASPLAMATEELRLVWAVDGSVTALMAADWINRLVAPGSSVDIVTVMPPAAVSPEVADNDRRLWRRQAEDAKNHLVPGRFHVRVHVLSGRPGPTLMAFVKEQGAGLMMVGRKRRSERADRLAESVARYVEYHADCPILMVPTQKPIDDPR